MADPLSFPACDVIVPSIFLSTAHDAPRPFCLQMSGRPSHWSCRKAASEIPSTSRTTAATNGRTAFGLRNPFDYSQHGTLTPRA